MWTVLIVLTVILVLVMAFTMFGAFGPGPRVRRRTIVERPLRRPVRRRRVVEEDVVDDGPPVV